MDAISTTMMTFGIILAVCSWIQLIIVSFDEDYSWGLTSIFLPAISYVYGLYAWEKAKDAWAMAFIGWILVFLALQ